MANNLPSLFGSFLGLFRRTERRPAPRRRPERRFKPGLECCEQRVVPALNIISDSITAGTYTVGQAVTVSVTFNNAVNVIANTGTPAEIPLTFQHTNGTPEAVYQSGTGTTTLNFSYTVASGDLSSGISIGPTLSSNAYSFNGNTGVTLTLPTTSFPSVNINSTTTISNITVTPGNYGLGAILPVVVTFSGPVTVTGHPNIDLQLDQSNGTTNNVVAKYASGSGTNTLTFDYTVAGTDLDTNGVQVGLSANNSMIHLPNGATILDNSGNTPNLTFSKFTSGTNVLVDGVQPVVNSFTYNNDFSAGTGLLSFDLQIKLPSVATFPTLSTSSFEALTISSPSANPANSPIGSGLNSQTTIQSVTLLTTATTGTPSFTTLTYKITVHAGNGIGRLALFLVDNTINPTLKDSFGNVLAGLTPTTSTLFPSNSEIISSISFGAAASVAHNYHII